ncbi:hypothetical protein LHFGNBLO_006126 (plasmid) [Mesorhizobium sp. AR10]|uniref:hypothetical protein n=1 Tax=unclassified Mesorhizobium TaxID=325217 RepID=UPI00215E6058|nr:MULTISPECIES: hypothetical protein [unclassified Mesorhizobium]UVK35885.1 hypothetical protein LHFGNBLO_006126 [Mesorhizobium sp. AR10]
MVQAVGNHLNVGMGALWQPDDAFFDLLRDKELADACWPTLQSSGRADGNFAEKV